MSACRMTRGQEENFTIQVGRKRGTTRGTPSTSSIISFLSMGELRAYCEIPDDIDVVLSEGPVENTVGEEYNAVFFHPGKISSHASLPHAISGQAILALYQSASCPYSPKCHSDSYWVIRSKPSLPARSFIGGGLFCLYLEGSTRWSDVHVSPEPLVAIH